MATTPVEIRHVRLGRGLFGYRRRATDELLAEIADSFEDVWRERADLEDRVEHLEEELQRHRDLEALLRRTLVSAESAAQELREQARRDAAHVVDEAHAEARRIIHTARAGRERLLLETAQIRGRLATALDLLENEETEAEAA